MKKHRYIIFSLLGLLIIAGCQSLNTETPPINGEFESNFDKTYEWLIKTNDPMLKHGKDKVEKVYNDPFPLTHIWKDGEFKVIINAERSEKNKQKWTKIDKQTYQYITPADKFNTETKCTIRIITEDEYYIELEVNGRVTREYFKRKNGEQEDSGNGVPPSQI